MAQGTLPFHYEADTSGDGATAHAGLGVYLDLIKAIGLVDAVGRHVHAAGAQGWLDQQMVVAGLLLNLSGADCVDDLDRLEQDRGLARLVRAAERGLLTRAERRQLKQRMRRRRERALPSPTAFADWLARFHDAAEEAKRAAGKAFVPAAGAPLQGLARVGRDLIGFLDRHRPERIATIDGDATLVGTHKRQALYCYKKFRAYQPLNMWWAEHGVILHSEFRDGNVPAGMDKLRVFREAIAYLPAGVETVRLRTDTAGYDHHLLLYCGEGKDERFGVIEFAIGADVTAAFKTAVRAVPTADWKPLHRIIEGKPQDTGQQWAEVAYVPNWAGTSRKRADYRFLAIREPLDELELGDAEQLPFPTEVFGTSGRHKLFAVVTNRTLPGDEVIRWHRERCGKSEEAHSVMKEDLAGGQLPSGLFGANAAWWSIMVLAHNLNAVMKRLVLGPAWVTKRMKALRFALINLPARVLNHARRLIVRLPAGSAGLDLIGRARAAIVALQAPVEAPSG